MSLESLLLRRRVIWNVLPAAFVVGALWSSVVGENGILNRHQIKARLSATEAEVHRVESENESLRSQIVALKGNPTALRRVTATTLLRAEPGTTIYRLDPSGD